MLETIIWILTYIAYGIFVWMSGCAIHELFHYWEGKRQGADVNIKIWYWHGFPSLMTTYDKLKSPTWFFFMGGFGAGCVLCFSSLIVPFIVWQPFSWWQFFPFGIGVINWVYSVYEMVLIQRIPRDLYMIGHYALYMITGFLFTILYWGNDLFARTTGV